MHTVRQPFDAIFSTYMPQVPAPTRETMTRAGCKAIAFTFIAPLVTVFGIDQVQDFVEGVDEFSIRYRLHGAIFGFLARINARVAALRDRFPGINALRRWVHRDGPPGIDRVVAGMSSFARKYHDIALAYTHHDESTAGTGFGPPRTKLANGIKS